MSKEQRVIDYLTERFLDGRIKLSGKLPSATQLSSLCQVNRETANKAVSRLVERGWVERRGGAGGSVLVRLPSHGSRPKIAYRCSLLSAGLYSSRMLRGAQQAATERGYDMLYYETPWESDQRSFQNSAILSSGASGILSATGLTLAGDEGKLPCVYLGIAPPGSQHYLCPDRVSGAFAMAERAISLGHRCPALVMNAGLCEVSSGILRAYRDHGIEVPGNHLVYCSDVHQFMAEACLAEIRRSIGDCSIIFCASDSLAICLIHACDCQGISVPEDLSITGFGTMVEYQSLRAITSVEEFPDQLGYQGAQRLIDIIEGKRENCQESFKTEIIQGTTLGRH